MTISQYLAQYSQGFLGLLCFLYWLLYLVYQNSISRQGWVFSSKSYHNIWYNVRDISAKSIILNTSQCSRDCWINLLDLKDLEFKIIFNIIQSKTFQVSYSGRWHTAGDIFFLTNSQLATIDFYDVTFLAYSFIIHNNYFCRTTYCRIYNNIQCMYMVICCFSRLFLNEPSMKCYCRTTSGMVSSWLSTTCLSPTMGWRIRLMRLTASF